MNILKPGSVILTEPIAPMSFVVASSFALEPFTVLMVIVGKSVKPLP